MLSGWVVKFEFVLANQFHITTNLQERNNNIINQNRSER